MIILAQAMSPTYNRTSPRFVARITKTSKAPGNAVETASSTRLAPVSTSGSIPASKSAPGFSVNRFKDSSADLERAWAFHGRAIKPLVFSPGMACFARTLERVHAHGLQAFEGRA